MKKGLYTGILALIIGVSFVGAVRAGGTNIGGYPATTASATVTPTTLTDPSLTTYWVEAGTNIPVSFQYCVSIQGASTANQCSLPANASFNVTGPAVSLDTTTSDVSVGLTPLSFGFFVPPDTSGIIFSATATQPDVPGSLIFVQLVDGYTGQYFGGNNCAPFDYGTGLDVMNPSSGIIYYDQSPVGATDYSTNDSPSIPLFSDDSEATADFVARMYLLWQPDIPSSIPVPIGFVPWSWEGEAEQSSNIWSVIPKSVVASSNPTLVPTTYLPTWSSFVTIPLTPPCH